MVWKSCDITFFLLHKVTEHLEEKALNTTTHTVTMKPRYHLLVWVSLQETRSRTVWRRSCFHEVDMIIIPLSSSSAGASLTGPPLSASSHHSSPPPSVEQVTQPRCDSAACGWPTPSIIQRGRVYFLMLCCRAAVHWTNWNKHKVFFKSKSCFVWWE